MKKPNGESYAADSIFYLVLGIQVSLSSIFSRLDAAANLFSFRGTGTMHLQWKWKAAATFCGVDRSFLDFPWEPYTKGKKIEGKTICTFLFFMLW